MTYVMVTLTTLVSLYKADFVNLTIYCLAIYTFSFKERGEHLIDWEMWRRIVTAIALSIVYDILWFIIKHGEFNATATAAATADGGAGGS